MVRRKDLLFADWLITEFGNPRAVRRAAESLGYAVRTVRSWRDLERFPNARAQEIIRLKSAGRVNIDAWRRVYLAKKDGEVTQ